MGVVHSTGHHGRVQLPPSPPPAQRAPAWLDELDLTVAEPSHVHQMGTRRIDPGTWLHVDAARTAELAHKAELLDVAPSVMVGWLDDVEAGAVELLDEVVESLRHHHNITVEPADGLHPLDAAGRLVQEDLCLLRRTASGAVLVGGSLCFASAWRLHDKLGLPMAQVHAPVPRYNVELRSRVDRFLARLAAGSVVARRNWLVYQDPALHQVRHEMDPSGTSFVLRSERQTMRLLPRTEHIVFTIRVQRVAFSALAERPDVAAAMASYFRDGPPAVADAKGITPCRAEVLAQLDHHANA